MDDFSKELGGKRKPIPIEYYLELMVSISLRFIQGKVIFLLILYISLLNQFQNHSIGKTFL